MAGVARNMAEAAARCGSAVRFLTAVGRDLQGDELQVHCRSVQVETQVWTSPTLGSPTYLAILNDKGDLVTAIEAMAVSEALPATFVHTHVPRMLTGAGACLVDGNFAPEVIGAVCSLAHDRGVPVWFEPTSVPKSARIRAPLLAGHVWLVTPNLDELYALTAVLGCAVTPPAASHAHHLTDQLDEGSIHRHCQALLAAAPGLAHIVLKLGAHGAWLVSRPGAPYHLPAAAAALSTSAVSASASCVHRVASPSVTVVNTSGAGDSLVGAMLAAALVGRDLRPALAAGVAAARLTLQFAGNVAPALSARAIGIDGDERPARPQ